MANLAEESRPVGAGLVGELRSTRSADAGL